MRSHTLTIRAVAIVGIAGLAMGSTALGEVTESTADARARISEMLQETSARADSPLRFGDPRLSFEYFQSTEGAAKSGPGAADTKEKADEAEAEKPRPGEESKSADSEQDLATKLQNPVADLISVPFQFNWDTGLGPDEDKDRITVNIQPVIPIHLNEEWNLISRTILPVIYADGLFEGDPDEFGIGDTTQSFFFSPRDPIDGWILGVGPVAQIPTGSNDAFRSKQLSLGPTAVALRQDRVGDGVLTVGALMSHVWKVAGDDDVPNVNSTFLQPFIAYTLKGGSTFSLDTESTYDWTSEEWTVPVNLTFAQLMRIGRLPVQLQFGGRYYFDAPEDGPEWGIRCALTFLFPN